MQRVSVVGSSGSGKTTVGKAIAAALDLPFVELDGIHHQPGWQELPAEDFQASVEPIIAGEAWVVDGNYHSKGILDMVWERADSVVWPDMPRSLVMRRVVSRTIRRAATREELWNGNVEPWSNFFDPRPERNIISWAWTRYPHTKERYAQRVDDPRWAHLNFIRLTSQAEVDDFLTGLRKR
jgi:adenylate kinase family enzyme